MRKSAFAGLVGALVASVACVDQPKPTEPSVDASTPRLSRIGGGDEELQSLDYHLARINDRIPEFGGLFFAEDGTPTVYVTDLSAAEAASDVVTNSFYTAEGINRVTGPVRAIQGDYTFLQLDAWRDAATSVLAIDGVVYTDVDESQNRVAIGIEATADRSAVEAELAQQGIPAEAVVITETEPIVFAATLRERNRPLAGGLQIVWPTPTGALFICTLGFNVRRPGSTENLFVTNSHCSGLQGGVQNTPFYQPSPTIDATVIAREILDPEYIAGPVGGFACPAGRSCRLSDASLAQYTPGQDVFYGAIYRTTMRGSTSGSIEINDANPRFYITDEAPFGILGQRLDKLGRTTGWNSGLVIATCFSTNVGGTTFTQHCQDRVGAGVGGGDSGSPVFNSFGESNHVTLYGILWGGPADGSNFVFSPLQNIETAATELGPLNTNPFSNPVTLPVAR